MKIKFYQLWTDQDWKLGHIEFFRFAWEINNSYWCFYIVILNFAISIDIG